MKFDKLNKLGYDDFFEPMILSVENKARRQELADLLTDVFLYFFSVYEVHQAYNSMLERALYEQLLNDKISDAVSQVTGIDGEMSNHIRTLSREVVDTTIKHANEKNQVGQNSAHSLKTHNDSFTALDYDSAESLDSPEYSSDSHIQEALRLKEEEDGDEEDDVEEIMKDEAEKNYWLSINRAMNIAYNEANTFFNYTDYVEAKNRGYKFKTWRTMNDPKVRETHAELDGHTIDIDKAFTVGTSNMLFPHDWMTDSDPKEIINCRCSVDYS